jgi:hypothetical protein
MTFEWLDETLLCISLPMCGVWLELQAYDQAQYRPSNQKLETLDPCTTVSPDLVEAILMRFQEANITFAKPERYIMGNLWLCAKTTHKHMST